MPVIPGADTFPGAQLHSHNYRTREAFKGQRVVVVGAQASGMDISREIAEVASQARSACHLLAPCSRALPFTRSALHDHAAGQAAYFS